MRFFRYGTKNLIIGSTSGTSGSWTPTDPIPDPGILWPTQLNTGVLSGVTRTNYGGGSLGNNDVLENRNVSGTIEINGNDVTIRNCKLVFNSYYGIIWYSGTNLLIEDCEIDGRGSNGMVGMAVGNATVRRCNIYGMVIASHIWGTTLYRDNYIHDLAEASSDPDQRHFDGIALHGGTGSQFLHNAFHVSEGTASTFITTKFGDTSNILVEDNLMVGRGVGYHGYAENDNSGTYTMSNITYNRNHIQKGIYGYILTSGGGNNVIDTNNVKFDATTPAEVQAWSAVTGIAVS